MLLILVMTATVTIVPLQVILSSSKEMEITEKARFCQSPLLSIGTICETFDISALYSRNFYSIDLKESKATFESFPDNTQIRLLENRD